uniref:LIM zinc-binding domain-containing protein n=1 Tax=Acrobeloides nanus TaxID=290746 RepID=A0A914CAH7_9BILA
MLAELETNLQRYNSKRSIPGQNASAYDLRQKDITMYESMIGGISPDANRHGIHTIPKGDCAGCGRPIIGQIIMAFGKMWHPEHFNCSQCGTELGNKPFYERAGKAYCENDYHDLFSPRCSYCNGPIKDRCINALGKNFHVEHFVCTECGNGFGSDGYHEKDGLPYCRQDFFRLFAPKCKACHEPVSAKFLSALGATWHQKCFVCQDCSRPFIGGAYFELNGMPLCEQHYHERRGSVCGACKQPISGKCVVALGDRFHPEHFCCHNCNKQLDKKTFKDYNGQAFCQKCYEKIHPSFQILN